MTQDVAESRLFRDEGIVHPKVRPFHDDRRIPFDFSVLYEQRDT